MANYDATKIGVPFTRLSRLFIAIRPDGSISLNIEQDEAVKLADSTIRALGNLPATQVTFDAKTDTEPFPLFDANTGAQMGETNLASVLLALVALARKGKEKAAEEACNHYF